MKFENTEVFNFKGALRGMRNPMESWSKSDTIVDVERNCNYDCKERMIFEIGKNDLELAQKLIKAGQPHRKFMRQILISVDITAPLYWWKEFDTYKVGTVANSTSTMHKLASTPITIDCFEMDDFEDVDIEVNGMIYSNKDSWNTQIVECEYLRQKYNELVEQKKHLEEIKDFEEAKKAQVTAKIYWKALIRKLSESWLQKRTITMSYENVLKMVEERKNHKLTEWSVSFMEWVKTLPYAEELLLIS